MHISEKSPLAVFTSKPRGFLRNNYVFFTIVKLFPMAGRQREGAIETQMLSEGLAQGRRPRQQLARTHQGEMVRKKQTRTGEPEQGKIGDGVKRF